MISEATRERWRFIRALWNADPRLVYVRACLSLDGVAFGVGHEPPVVRVVVADLLADVAYAFYEGGVFGLPERRRPSR